MLDYLRLKNSKKKENISIINIKYYKLQRYPKQKFKKEMKNFSKTG